MFSNTVTYPEFLWADWYIYQSHKSVTMVGAKQKKCQKFVPPNALKMHYLALFVLRFLCKIFSKLLKFALRNTLRGLFFKNSYIQIKNLYGYKLLRAAK